MTRPLQSSESVASVACYVLAHPWETFVERWNWKAAVLSAAFRGVAFAVPMSHFAGPDAVRALCIELGFRVAIGGFWGSLLQAFRRAEPAWAAGVSVAALLPAAAHLLEFAALKAGHVSHITTAMIVSVVVSSGSLLLNFGLMRHGLLVTGTGAAPLFCDLQRIPAALAAMLRRSPRDV
jgi:hypothetical protein